jgi:HK97 family phage prohead protease
MSLKEFLALLAKNRKGIAANRVGTADHYVRTLQACTGPLCPAGKASIPPDVFATALKRAASTPVYRNQDMGIVGALKAADASAPAGLRPVAVLDYVATSKRQDRDSDILEPKGCVIDPAMPFLWQHDATAPIGRLFATVSRDENAIQLRSGIADTPLGNDAAYLAEFGALRISHGFRPQKFEPLTEKNGEVFLGFHVLEYEMMETSLVSVPSNTDAIITAFSREKLGSPVAKSWAKGFSDRRQRFVAGGWAGKRAGGWKPRAGKVAPKTGRKAGKLAPKGKKDAAEWEQSLATACEQIKHSGDYGVCLYRPAEADPAKADVWWVMADADDGTADDGTELSTSEEIKGILGAVEGVASVTVESEGYPPKDEGWRMVYPSAAD